MPTAYSTLMVIWLMYVFVLTMIIMFKRVDRGQRVHELPMGPRSSYISKSLAWKWMTLPAIPSIVGFYVLAGGFHGVVCENVYIRVGTTPTHIGRNTTAAPSKSCYTTLPTRESTGTLRPSRQATRRGGRTGVLRPNVK